MKIVRIVRLLEWIAGEIVDERNAAVVCRGDYRPPNSASVERMGVRLPSQGS
jgi:hypothetical protein